MARPRRIRRTFTPDDKRRIVAQVRATVEGGGRIKDVLQAEGIRSSALTRWRKEYPGAAGALLITAPGAGAPAKRLYRRGHSRRAAIAARAAARPARLDLVGTEFKNRLVMLRALRDAESQLSNVARAFDDADDSLLGIDPKKVARLFMDAQRSLGEVSSLLLG